VVSLDVDMKLESRLTVSAYRSNYELLFPLITILLPVPTSLVMTTYTATQERSDIELLPMNNIHGLISIVQIIPAWRLMRRVTSPNITESIRMLGLRAVDSAIRPGTGPRVSSCWIFELVYCCADDGL
jgi:hypothetical protein